MKHVNSVAARRSLAMQGALVLGGSALIALAAQVSVPMFPVPMTLQTLAISLIGLTYGSRLAALTVLAYLAEGAMGLPVFAGAGAGIASLMGPTAGFLWGYIPMVWLTGWLVERGLDRGVPRLFAAAVLPAMLLYVPGTIGVALFTGMGISAAVTVAVLPFILGDAVKTLIAAMAVSGSRIVTTRL